MKYILVILTLFVCWSCSTTAREEPCTCDTSAVESNKKEVDRMKVKGYKEYLRRWQIPPIAGFGAECYRMCEMPTFGDFRIITVLKTDVGAKLSIVVYHCSRSKPETTMIRSRSVKMLTALDWIKLKNQVSRNCFWTEPMGEMIKGLDGSSWIIEGFDPYERNCASARHHFNHCRMYENNAIGNIGFYLSKLNE